MVLLVVGNYQAVNFSMIPWNKISAVTWVYCRKDSVRNQKYNLKVQCREHGKPLILQFAIPPSEELEIVPTELLKGFGQRLSEEVMLYDECIIANEPTKTDQIQKDCSYVLGNPERQDDRGCGINGT